MARYRIRTTNGETFEISGRDPRFIANMHPRSVITHEIRFDARGAGVPIPYAGVQPGPRDPESASDDQAAPRGSRRRPAKGKNREASAPDAPITDVVESAD